MRIHGYLVVAIINVIFSVEFGFLLSLELLNIARIYSRFNIVLLGTGRKTVLLCSLVSFLLYFFGHIEELSIIMENLFKKFKLVVGVIVI